MPAEPDLAGVAALIGEPARGRMLAALLAGRALTATELALEGGVAPSTASSHLGRLRAAGLVTMVRQGRHRYFRLAGPAVASALEGLLAIAPRSGKAGARPGPRDERLRQARVCYDHLAGEVGVRLLAALRSRGLLRAGGDGLRLSVEGEAWCLGLGIDVAALGAQRRPLCRQCLDWSERQYHLGGALGAAILDRLLARRLVRRQQGSRALDVSPRGEAFLVDLRLPSR